MSRFNLRQRPRISYCEPEDPDLDEYVYCDECDDYVFEYCAIHGPLLVVPDDKVPAVTNFPSYVPRAALTIPHVFLHLAHSRIPDAGLGVFTTLTLPRGVRFGPYRGEHVKEANSGYCWQIYDSNRRPKYVVDASDADRSNWLRYVNCARHCSEQNLIAYQYQGQLYYRTIKLIPRFTELLVFYGSEFANLLGISLKNYNKPNQDGLVYHIPVLKKPRLEETQTIAKGNEKNDENTTKEVATSEITSHTKITEHEEKKKEVTKNLPQKKEETVKTKRNSKQRRQKNKITIQTDIINKLDEASGNSSLNKKNESQNAKNLVQPVVDTSDRDKAIAQRNSEILTCDICEYKTNVVKILNSHLKVHASMKRFSCDFCPYITKSKPFLSTHMRIHTGDKPYSCNVCLKKFSVKSSLDRHMRIHTGDKPYSCNVCHEKFTQKNSLDAHMRIHTGDKPYSCNVCFKNFTIKINLDRHMRKHTGEKPYSCNVCFKKFIIKIDLDRHMRIHTGEKPYSCNVCHKKFTVKFCLDRHMRIHTGEKPYSCDICQAKFSDKSNLNSHIKKHNNIKS